MKTLLLSCVFLLFSDPCALPPEESKVDLKTNSPSDDSYTRFEIERVAKFQDDLAYNDERGIYIIKDKKTGIEYLGISGIGISELGSHSVGKQRKTDER